MSDWNSNLYLKFDKERSLPAADLAMKISSYNPQKIADIGCGPGNSTRILKDIFPCADIIGIDNSPNMIEKAKSINPDIDFLLCDAMSLEGKYDLLFSNACFQWIPNHHVFIPSLMEKLNVGGLLAVQMPHNSDSPLYRIIDDAVSDKKWGFDSLNIESNITLHPKEYYNILSECSSSFEIWETTYYHSMPSHEAMVEWVKSAKLRPYLNLLSERQGQELINEIISRSREKYSIEDNGQIMFGFKRLFFIAVK